MKRHAWLGWVVTLALVVGGGVRPAAAFVMEGPLIGSLRQVMAGNFEAYNKKDINALMQGIDSRSPTSRPVASRITASRQVRALFQRVIAPLLSSA